jgi:tetratricopeptide (TPR) repeat protein
MSAAKRCLGEREQAVELGHKALHLATERNLTDVLGEAANALGEALVASGDLDGAMRTFRHAVESAEQVKLPRFLARGLNGIAHVMRARGDRAAARRYWVHALKVNPPDATAWADTAAHLDKPGACELCRAIDSIADTEPHR